MRNFNVFSLFYDAVSSLECRMVEWLENNELERNHSWLDLITVQHMSAGDDVNHEELQSG
jgi:hypothetical protein